MPKNICQKQNIYFFVSYILVSSKPLKTQIESSKVWKIGRSRKRSFKKYVRRAGEVVVGGGGRGGGGILKKRTKTNTGRGGSSLSVLSLCEKNCQIFKQQADFLFISCLIVPKCFLFSFLFSFKFLL